MATPRYQLVDPETPLCYHLVSRCVRRSWLCGTDSVSGNNYDHRKEWLQTRMMKLAGCYAVELFGYAVMSNHFHMVVRYDPTAEQHWSDDEVARRWAAASSYSTAVSEHDEVFARALRYDALLKNPAALARARKNLGSLSSFMKHLKQPITWRANREDGCTGHFFESRFYSGVILNDAALVAAIAYVDLNPVRAKLVKDAIDADHTSLQSRCLQVNDDPALLDAYLAPLAGGIESEGSQSATLIPVTLRQYLDIVSIASSVDENEDEDDDPEQKRPWYERLALFKRRQRVYGFADQIAEWAASRGWSRPGLPFV